MDISHESYRDRNAGKDTGKMNSLSDDPNNEKSSEGNATHVMRLNGQSRSAPLSFKSSPGGYDDWTSSTGTSLSSCTVSSASNSIENGTPPHVLLTDRLTADQTKLSSPSGSDRKESGEANRSRSSKKSVLAHLDAPIENASFHGAETYCESVGDYVESALISSNASLLSSSSNKLQNDADSSQRSPRLSSFQSFSTLNQDANALGLDSNIAMKPDFVTLDYIKSAVHSERRSKANVNNSDSCSSSLSSSFMSSIASEDGSSIGSDVVENLRNKIAAAAAKHKLKSPGASQQDQEHEQDSFHYLKTDYQSGNTEGSLSFNRVSANDFPPPPALHDTISDGIVAPFESRDHEKNAESPDSFGRFQRNANEQTDEVTELDLSNTNLKEVPDYVQDYASTLLKLSLESNAIVELPKELFNCRRLRELIIGDNDVSKLPASLAGLTDLKHLDISKNVIEDIPDCMPCLKNLEVLDASVNPIEILSEGFTQLISLRELYMNDCFFDYLPASFGRMSELRVLELRDNQLQILPKSIRRLLNLEQLDLGGNVLQDWPDVISKLTNLRELWLDGNELNRVSTEIGQLVRLTYLDLSKNLLTSVPNQVGSLDLVTDLLLAENSITSLPESIGFMRCLTALSVEHNQIEKLPDSIGKLQHLEELDASHNNLKKLPSSVGKLRKLQMLLLDDNHLSELPRELGDCVSLSVLQLSQNQIEVLPDSLGELQSLRVLNISQNRIHHLPITLRNLTQLEALWISPNQSKPSVPVHVDIHPDGGFQILTNLLFPQEKNGLSRVSKVLGSYDDVDDDDDQQFAIDAADDDDLEAYSRRERGRSQVVFDLSLTTYSEVADYDGSDFVDVTGVETSRGDFDENIIDVSNKQLTEINVADVSDLSKLSTTTNNDNLLDRFAIDIPKTKEATGLVVSLGIDSTADSERLSVVFDNPVINDRSGNNIGSKLPSVQSEVDTKRIEFTGNSLQELDFIDQVPSSDNNILLTTSNEIELKVEPKSDSAISKSGLQSSTTHQLLQKDVIWPFEARDNTISQPQQRAESTGSGASRSEILTKPSGLGVEEFHATSRTSTNKQPASKLVSVGLASLAEAEKGQGLAERSKDYDVASLEKNTSGKHLKTAEAVSFKAANVMNASEKMLNPEILSVTPEKASSKSAVIESDYEVASIPSRIFIATKSSSIVSEDDSGVGVNDVEAQEATEERREADSASSSSDPRFKVSWKSTSTVVEPISFKQDQTGTSVNSSERQGGSESTPLSFDSVKKPLSQITEPNSELQVVESSFSKPRKPFVPPPPPRKTTVADNIKRFEKQFERNVTVSALKSASDQKSDRNSPRKSNQTFASSKPSVEVSARSKPMAIATILPSSNTTSEPDALSFETVVNKPDIDDVMIANDVLKSLDLYTKGKEIQRKILTSDYVDGAEENENLKTTESSPNEKRSDGKRQSFGRKSKFDEALAATKHKHFREKLEKAMQLQQQNTPAGDTLRRLSRGSTSSITNIPRITSPVPQHHGFASERVKTSTEERSKSQSSSSLKGNPKRAQTAGLQNKHQPTPTDSLFGKRGSALRSSLRSSSRNESDSNSAPPKVSLEEQLGELLIDGSSTSSSDQRGFVPYLPDEFCLSTSTRSIKRSSSKEKSQPSGDFNASDVRRPTRPGDWRNQLLDYLEKKKSEKRNPNPGKPHHNLVPQASNQFTNAQNLQRTSAAPKTTSFNEAARALNDKNAKLASTAALQSRSSSQLKAPHFSNHVNSQAPPKLQSKPISKQYSFSEESPGNITRNVHQRSSGRRSSSSKYQRTRTPGPEMMSSEPKVKDLTVRPKSAMDRPISSVQNDIYSFELDRNKELPPKDHFYKVHPQFTSAPPTYEDHILRQMKAGTYSEGQQTYVNLEQLHSRLRASMKQKEQQSKTNQTPSTNHVTSSAKQSRDLSAKPSAIQDRFVNKQESKTLLQNPPRVPSHTFSPDNHQSRVQYAAQRPYHQPLPLQKTRHYVEKTALRSEEHHPLYEDLPRVQPQYQYGNYVSKYVTQLPPSNPVPYIPHPMEIGGRPTKNEPLYVDPYYLTEQRGYRQPSAFLSPESNQQHSPYAYSNPYQDEYVDNDESTVSAFRPYQHQPINHNRRKQPPHIPYNAQYPSVPPPYKDERAFYHSQPPIHDPQYHQDYQYSPGNLGGYVQDQYPLDFNQDPFERGLKLSTPDGPPYSSHDVRDFGVELVSVTVRKDPNFGFHIMGGVDAGGNPYRLDDEGVFVTYVAPGGAADGLVKPGDKILMVNGSDFVGISHKRAVDLLKNAGQAAVLVVERVVGRPV